jgi:RNA polymerase sigma-70 factor (ECF subfamily)
VHAHYGRLCDFAYHLVRSRAVAEDLVQDVFVAIMERGAAFSYDDPMPYLFQATRNRALSHLRKLRVHERFAAGTALATHAAPSPADSVERHELARALDLAVAALPMRCRQVFILSRVQRMTYAEIARALGISVKTVETQMGRALRSLRTRVAPFLSVVLLALTDARLGDGIPY